MEIKSSTKAPPNELSTERHNREQNEAAARELVTELKDTAKDTASDETIIQKRIGESEKDREARRGQHIADERMLAEVGRVREIEESLSRDADAYLAKLDNAARRLRGLAGSANKPVQEAVQAVAKAHGLKVTPEGMKQPKTESKPGSILYPFYD